MTKNILSSVIHHRALPHVLVACGIALFLGFGFSDLGHFETTDEHFWKFDRIQKYYNGIEQGLVEGQWKKTRINDKPGVTVAWLSGIGLPFADVHPEDLRDEAREETLRAQYGDTAVSAFHADATVATNTALRAPIVLFSAVMLGVLYWLLRVLVGSAWVAAFVTFGIALSPVLVGMSRVINPDAVLWSVMSAALIGFLAFVRRGGRSVLVATTLLTGLALLSKYTASLLFVLLPIALALFVVWSKEADPATFMRWYRTRVAALVVIVLGGCAIFALGMPAVLQKPEHFLYGTFLSPALTPIAPIVGVLYAMFLVDAFALKGRIAWWCARTAAVRMTAHVAGKVLAALLLLVAALSLANVHKAAPWLPLTDIKEVGRDGGELIFPQIVFTDGPLHELFVLVAQSQNMLFALLSVLLVLFIVALSVFVCRKRMHHTPELTFILITIFVFLGGGIVADVFVNVRYGIVLYPLIIVFTGIVLWQTLRSHWASRSTAITIGLVLIAASLICELAVARPFYLTYENTFLPKQSFVTDAWGYGFYEAAVWLNTQPDAENVVVWSDGGGDLLCQFFVGSCLRPQKIDAAAVVPDYLVLTRRRSAIRPFQLTNEEGVLPSASALIAQDPVWQLNMNDRPDNYIKIIKVSQ